MQSHLYVLQATWVKADTFLAFQRREKTVEIYTYHALEFAHVQNMYTSAYSSKHLKERTPCPASILADPKCSSNCSAQYPVLAVNGSLAASEADTARPCQRAHSLQSKPSLRVTLARCKTMARHCWCDGLDAAGLVCRTKLIL
ncbi:hypothetical protein RRG08_016235 [Elysia crispata]|uniref:Uncharacterized protein n=1 Tax=Elysia crispata TaxID=231223 RepID=A0AAE1DJU1_9GAST|nr:hypothetical protein RRG08_016235 [Elysia crispata]